MSHAAIPQTRLRPRGGQGPIGNGERYLANTKQELCLSWHPHRFVRVFHPSLPAKAACLSLRLTPRPSIHPPISVITRYLRTPLHPRSTFSLFLPGSSFVIVFLFSSHQVALSPISDTHIPCPSALPSQSNGRFLLAPNGTIPSRARGVIPRITVHTSRVRRPSPDKHSFLLFCHPESTHSLGSSTDRQSSTPSVPLKPLSLFFLFLPLLFLLLFPYLHLPDSSQDHQPVNPSPS
ncbi:uncharacterized protein CCOS01_03550 [Colletotrichum costaricense]|uniref:Uncharacterized protein n=3 Tax=Colletotrichum acutatum species complex TaxID=2707335 RepID=A0AAI9Z500_9PEZI|nr:uncharacterized protein CCOS01_03550 [Colletotrichum costaricense]KAI3534337.1 hypothetical protein CSPX01_12106 [Colletotrichum filicis]KAK1534798.1 hypothetical protein CCOS01_03550 [Colletotrichum costaricense]